MRGESAHPELSRRVERIPGGALSPYPSKMSNGRNADTQTFGRSTTSLTLKSTATLVMQYACSLEYPRLHDYPDHIQQRLPRRQRNVPRLVPTILYWHPRRSYEPLGRRHLRRRPVIVRLEYRGTGCSVFWPLLPFIRNRAWIAAAISTAVPHVSPSPCAKCPSPAENIPPSTNTGHSSRTPLVSCLMSIFPPFSLGESS